MLGTRNLLALFACVLLLGCGGGSSAGDFDGGPGGIDAASGGIDGSVPPITTGPGTPAVERGGGYMGFSERFNRYYTEPEWEPLRTIYVSVDGTGDGTSTSTPASVTNGLASVQPGDLVVFLRGTYAGCFELDTDQSGTYDQPVVLRAERNPDESRGVRINCCDSGRRTCFNLENASYVAIDGFELVGGKYGVRAVSASYATADHTRGNAVLNSHGHDNAADPFFTGGADWFVIENNLAERGGNEDGHGIYLSNGSDWNIARYNVLNENSSADFQINADPASTCTGEGIDVFDAQCAGNAADGNGDGVSEFILVEGNYFHNGTSQGANFTSVRNSVIRNNVFAFYARHGVSFWQETPNPQLGSSDNAIHHNLFVGMNQRELLQFTNNSDRNDVRNNVFVGVSINGNTATSNASTVLLATSDTSASNVFADNLYIGGRLITINDDFDETGTLEPGSGNQARSDFDPAWFAEFPYDLIGTASGFMPTGSAPWLDQGALLPGASADREGTPRTAPTDLGPFEVP